MWHFLKDFGGQPDLAFVGEARPVFEIGKWTRVLHSKLGIVCIAEYEPVLSDWCSAAGPRYRGTLSCVRWGRYALYRDYGELLQDHHRRGLIRLRPATGWTEGAPLD